MKNIIIFLLFTLLLFIYSCDKNPTAIDFAPFTWNVSTPAAQSMNPAILDSAFIKAGKTGFIDGLVVIRNGAIIREQHYNGYNQYIPHDIRSDSKSFLSALAGIALEKGYIKSIDDKVLDYFPEYISPNMDPRKFNITIRHLLTMRMGLQDESTDNYNAYMEIYNYPMFMAYGYGGQFIIVFPTLNLIVVSTATYLVDGDTSTVQEWAIFDIIDRYICGAII
jgi:CubicO group peptidase (beta-lactamase class C family)